MYKLLALLAAFYVFSAQAKPSCLLDGTCMEYGGKLIDMRSFVQKELDKANQCDSFAENCYLKKYYYAEAPQLSKQDFQKLIQDNGTQYFIPLNLKTSDAIILAGALSLGTVVFSSDREIMDFVQENKGQVSQPVTDIGNFLGSRPGVVGVAAGAYFIGAVMKNGKLKQIGLFTIATGLATQIVTEVFKMSFGRTRPNGSDSPYEFGGDEKSFFSGHVSGAFSMATVIAEVYKDKPLVPYIAYGVATLTAYARMHDNKHWASDVLLGAAAGHLITKILMRTVLDTSREDGSGFIIIPELGRDLRGDQKYGVRVLWRPKVPNQGSKCQTTKLEGEAKIKLCFDEALNTKY